MSDALPPLAGRWGSDPSNPWGPPLPTRSASCFPVPPQTSLTWLGRSPSPGFLRKRSAMSVFVRACTCVGGRTLREARRNWFLRQPGAGRRQHPLPQVRGQVPGLARECLPSLTPSPTTPPPDILDCSAAYSPAKRAHLPRLQRPKACWSRWQFHREKAELRKVALQGLGMQGDGALQYRCAEKKSLLHPNGTLPESALSCETQVQPHTVAYKLVIPQRELKNVPVTH